MPFAGAVNEFKLGQVTEVLKIIIFSLYFPEPRVILASSKHPQRFDVSAFMLHSEYLHEWQCLGLVQAKPFASPPRGLSVIGTGLQHPLWGHEMVAGTRKEDQVIGMRYLECGSC